MKPTLLLAEVRATLPPLYGQRDETDPLVHIKLFVPDTRFAWYVTEGSVEGDEFVLYALAVDETGERSWEYVALSAVEAFRSTTGRPPERDRSFIPVRCSIVIAWLEAERVTAARQRAEPEVPMPHGRPARVPCIRCGSREIIGTSTCAACGATGTRRTRRGQLLG